MSTLPLMLLAVEREGGNSGLIFLVQMLLIFGIFYWLLIRPQRREQQRLRTMIQALKKGDEIVTNGGLVGTVIHLADDRVTIRSDNTKLVVLRSGVASVQPSGGGADE